MTKDGSGGCVRSHPASAVGDAQGVNPQPRGGHREGTSDCQPPFLLGDCKGAALSSEPGGVEAERSREDCFLREYPIQKWSVM